MANRDYIAKTVTRQGGAFVEKILKSRTKDWEDLNPRDELIFIFINGFDWQ